MTYQENRQSLEELRAMKIAEIEQEIVNREAIIRVEQALIAKLKARLERLR